MFLFPEKTEVKRNTKSTIYLSTGLKIIKITKLFYMCSTETVWSHVPITLALSKQTRCQRQELQEQN